MFGHRLPESSAIPITFLNCRRVAGGGPAQAKSRAPLTTIAKILKPEGKARLGVVFLSCMWAMAALLSASVLAFMHDGDVPIKWVELAYVVAAGFAALRFVRIAAGLAS